MDDLQDPLDFKNLYFRQLEIMNANKSDQCV